MNPEVAKVIPIGTLDEKESHSHEQPILIEPGNYAAVMIDWKVNYSGYFKKHSLLMHFRIVELGEFYGVVLPAWLNVKPSKGKTTVKAGWRSNFLRMYQETFNIKLGRNDRIPMSRFRDVLLRVEVETVGKDTNGKPLAKINQYSRVKRSLAVL